jgi:hypothetical protein
MSNINVPFNVTLLNLTDDTVGLKPVTVLDTLLVLQRIFNESGLFSVSIFGKVGDERRSRRFSYIDVKISIFHPIIYSTTKLKKMYRRFIAGKTLRHLSEEEILSSLIHLSNRFSIFFQIHWKDICFKRLTVTAETRPHCFDFDKYKDKTMLSKLVVLPAGLRDFEIEADGRQSGKRDQQFVQKAFVSSNNISKDAVVSKRDFEHHQLLPFTGLQPDL